MNDFPYPIIECKGEDALKLWLELYEDGKREGFYPVIVGGPEQIENHSEAFELNDRDPKTIIQDAAKLDALTILKKRKEAEADYYAEAELGGWPDTPSKQPLISCTDMRGNPLLKVVIIKIPTTRSYEAPAYLRYGGWNECPSPEEHVAIHRYWHEKYGSEIAAITQDVIECRVARPPRGREDALILAKEQFIYCSDIIFQGVETISALAAGLESHDIWYFWWD